MKRLYLLLTLAVCAFATPALATNCNTSTGTCFWIGGTGTLDLATDSAHWSNTTGGASCTCEPTSSSTLTFDASSGAGTVSFGADVTSGALVAGASSVSIDLNGHSPTFGNAAYTKAFDLSGTGTFTLTCGTGTIHLVTTTNGNIWDSNNANLTLSCASGTISIESPANANAQTFNTKSSGQSFGTINIGTRSNGGCAVLGGTSAAFTVANITAAATNTICLGNAAIMTVSGAFNLAGTSSGPIYLVGGNIYSGGPGNTSTLAAGNASSFMSWVALRGMVFSTNTVVCTNCFDLTHNSGTVTINGPTAGGGRIIGG